MEIPNPRRVLLVGPPDAGHIDLLKSLTGTAPSLQTNTLAGLSHTLPLKTSYYTAQVPVWIDELSSASPQTWSEDFLLPEAKEVLSALGALIVVFRKPVDAENFAEVKGILREVGKVVEQGCGPSWDGVLLAVGMRQDIVPHYEMNDTEWEEVCGGFGGRGGFEWVDAEATGRNEYMEKRGLERVKEALEAVEWDGGDDLDLDLDGLDEIDEDDGFGAEAGELEMEMFGMKRAIYGADEAGEGSGEKDEDEENDVEQLESMMLKLQAVKDMGAGLPEDERKRFAAKAVNDIMKTL